MASLDLVLVLFWVSIGTEYRAGTRGLQGRLGDAF